MTEKATFDYHAVLSSLTDNDLRMILKDDVRISDYKYNLVTNPTEHVHFLLFCRDLFAN